MVGTRCLTRPENVGGGSRVCVRVSEGPATRVCAVGFGTEANLSGSVSEVE